MWPHNRQQCRKIGNRVTCICATPMYHPKQIHHHFSPSLSAFFQAIRPLFCLPTPASPFSPPKSPPHPYPLSHIHRHVLTIFDVQSFCLLPMWNISVKLLLFLWQRDSCYWIDCINRSMCAVLLFRAQKKKTTMNGNIAALQMHIHDAYIQHIHRQIL